MLPIDAILAGPAIHPVANKHTHTHHVDIMGLLAISKCSLWAIVQFLCWLFTLSCHLRHLASADSPEGKVIEAEWR